MPGCRRRGWPCQPPCGGPASSNGNCCARLVHQRAHGRWCPPAMFRIRVAEERRQLPERLAAEAARVGVGPVVVDSPIAISQHRVQEAVTFLVAADKLVDGPASGSGTPALPTAARLDVLNGTRGVEEALIAAQWAAHIVAIAQVPVQRPQSAFCVAFNRICHFGGKLDRPFRGRVWVGILQGHLPAGQGLQEGPECKRKAVGSALPQNPRAEKLDEEGLHACHLLIQVPPMLAQEHQRDEELAPGAELQNLPIHALRGKR
mmetsp:Transcript_141735/g.440654  ORF Transcript_141735/g.440654 Transcript_141735/m.440654 type:complete len:261 (+) Transcript_141735:31-813(+)